jgi:uncharacterized protein YegL
MKSTDVVIVADVSGSMSHLQTKQQEAIYTILREFALQERAVDPHVYMVSLVAFGSTIGPATQFRPASEWSMDKLAFLRCTQGSTRLVDAVGEAIELVKARKPEAALIQVITDGGENASKQYTTVQVAGLLKEESSKDYLTLAATGPAEAGRTLAALGISSDCFRQWDGRTERSYGETMSATVGATQSYTTTRSRGIRSTTKFYADATKLTEAGTRGMTKQVTPAEVKTVSNRMDGRAIADFFKVFEKGRHYFQLVKPEYIDEDKELVVHIKDKDEYRQGSRTVRMLLGLPENGRIRVYPGPHSEKFDIYVQSASVNRKLVEGQKLLTL